ncbi:MAG TPA: superoxide dismutase family protein [Candidatus Polarisedimenticolia bacterium]|nr:superoxide dismutase family protein [Candidatus Polarisedimenticolia bacterium]
MIRSSIAAGAVMALLCGAQYAAGSQTQHTKPSGHGPMKKAVAVIESKSGSHVTGKASFHEANGKVTLKIRIEGAEPGLHAVHLHEKGDCSAPDAASAGGHWNPTQSDHGKWAVSPFHHGDIGNIEVGANGKGTFILTTDLWTIGGPPETDVIGKGIIIHAKVDDFTTQPTGNAGGRVGCGVVQAESK